MRHMKCYAQLIRDTSVMAMISRAPQAHYAKGLVDNTTICKGGASSVLKGGPVCWFLAAQP